MDQGKKTQFTNTGMKKTGEITTDFIDINRIIRGHYEQLYANQFGIWNGYIPWKIKTIKAILRSNG